MYVGMNYRQPLASTFYISTAMECTMPHINLMSSAKICSLNKMRDSEPKLFKEICMMHLSRTMDLAGDEFASLFHNLTHKTVSRKSVRINEQPSVMNGAPLTQEGICRIYQLVEYIEQNSNIKQTDIFRKCGNQARQFQLRLMLNSGATLDLSSNTFTVHDCCGVLKGFLSNLHEPLLTSLFFNSYLKIMDISSTCTNSQARQLKCLKIIFILLPLENYILLYNLLTLLNKVSKHEDLNGMTSEYLAIIFVPILLCPRELNSQELIDVIPKAVPVMRFMIENSMELFDVPVELLGDVVLHLKGLESGRMQRDTPVQSSIAFCQRQPLGQVQIYTEQKMQELLTDIQNMPNCQQKKIFLKRFQQQNNCLTPIKRIRTRSVSSSIKKLRKKFQL